MGRLHKGVASTYLLDLPAGTHVPVFVRKSTFRLPADASKGTIMIGPGTGLAPFRGFLQNLDLQVFNFSQGAAKKRQAAWQESALLWLPKQRKGLFV